VKLATFIDTARSAAPRLGILRADGLVDICRAAHRLDRHVPATTVKGAPTSGSAVPAAIEDLAKAAEQKGLIRSLDDLRLLPPIPDPSKFLRRQEFAPGSILDVRMREQVEIEVISSEARLRLAPPWIPLCGRGLINEHGHTCINLRGQLGIGAGAENRRGLRVGVDTGDVFGRKGEAPVCRRGGAGKVHL